MQEVIKLKNITCILNWEEKHIRIKFPFNKQLLSEIKAMDGARWSPENKEWTIKISERNLFQLEYLEGKNPYFRYDAPLFEFKSSRPLYSHQVEAVRHLITRKSCILAAEMGTGKTLCAIEAMEWAATVNGYIDWLWVGPRSAINAVKLEMNKWQSKIKPDFVTYSSLGKWLKESVTIPHGIVYDECSKIKTPTAQRSVAAMDLACMVRQKQGYVFLMSGTPAPHNPCDWYNISETACPGFLKEGNIIKFRNRLGIIEDRESLSGGIYPHLITWKNNPELCDKCGRIKDDLIHQPFVNGEMNTNFHIFCPSVNEVEVLGKRLRGLVLVQFKSECLDLPEKIYRTIRCKTPSSMLSTAKAIERLSPRAVTALTRLRELSDGFQYIETECEDKVTCELCMGTGQMDEYPAEEMPVEQLKPIKVVCSKCNGTGRMKKIIRDVKYVPTPKDDELVDLLEEFEDVGRVVIYAGFHASIDRIVELVKNNGWQFMRVDGRGWINSLGLKEDEMLTKFQSNDDIKIAFIAHPESGGMGLTLTASPACIFYSNDFKAENRIQAEDRIHRAGMDKQRGATIIDLINLKTDELILTNLKSKRDMQKVTMQELSNYINKEE